MLLAEEHQVPKDAMVVERCLCSSCGHGLYVRRSGKIVCRECASTFEFGNQVWVSSCCERPRKWGEDRPYDREEKMLKCANCGEISPHRFLEVAGYKS